MALPNTPFRPCGHVLHTRPALFVLINYAPGEGQPDWCNASCEFVEEGNADAGSALAVHISPFDALLNAAFVSSPGKPYHVVPAAAFDPRTLIRDGGGKLHINLHCGWANTPDSSRTRMRIACWTPGRNSNGIRPWRWPYSACRERSPRARRSTRLPSTTPKPRNGTSCPSRCSSTSPIARRMPERLASGRLSSFSKNTLSERSSYDEFAMCASRRGSHQ